MYKRQVFKISRVGSGHDPSGTGHVAGLSTLTNECFSLTRVSGPADPTIEMLAACCPKASVVQIRLWYHIRTLKHRHLYFNVHIHRYPLQPGHVSPWNTKNMYCISCKIAHPCYGIPFGPWVHTDPHLAPPLDEFPNNINMIVLI